MFENDPPRSSETPDPPKLPLPAFPPPPPASDPSPFETSAPAPAQPVPTSPVRPRGRFGTSRWPIAALAAVLVATASFAAWRVLANQPSTVSLADWAPQGTVIYAEARLVPSGEQHDKLAQFLAHFPGIGSAAALDSGLANVYEQLIRQASDGRRDYITEIQPWFGGTVGLALTRLPQVGGSEMGDPGVLVTADVKDQDAAKAWLSKVLASADKPPTTSTYANAELVTSGKGSAAVLSTVLLIGDTASVKTALDANGAGGLSGSTDYAAAARATDAQNLGFFYVNGKGYMDWLTAAAGSLGTTSLTTCSAALAAIPAWYSGSIRADADALTMRMAHPHGAPTAVTTNTRSGLAARLPASTVFVADQHELGTTVQKIVEQMGICGGTGKELVEGITSALQSVGGLAGLTGWMGEAAIAIDRDGDTPSGGVLIVPSNRAAAENLATLAGQFLAGQGAGVTVTNETYGGLTLSVIGQTGTPTRLAYVITDDIVAIGMESWVKKVVDTTAATSLASDKKFSDALARVSAENTQLMYADIGGLTEWIRGKLPASSVADYDTKVAPYIAPLDTLIVTSTTGADVDRADMVLTVK